MTDPSTYVSIFCFLSKLLMLSPHTKLYGGQAQTRKLIMIPMNKITASRSQWIVLNERGLPCFARSRAKMNSIGSVSSFPFQRCSN